MSNRIRTGTVLVVLAGALLLPGAASAQVVQSNGDGTPLPQPVNQAEVNLMFSFGFRTGWDVNRDFLDANLYPPVHYGDICRTVMIPGCPRTYPVFDGNPSDQSGSGLPPSGPGVNDAITFEGLFEWRGETINPQTSVRTGPGYFSPTCGFSGELVLRGGNCDLVFGWYNVLDPSNPAKPSDAEIYPLIPSPMEMGQSIEEFMNCQNQNMQPRMAGEGFCPLAWDNHDPYRPAVEAWTPRQFSSGAIAQHPNYGGKFIAFALIGKAGSQCTQTKYSMPQHNVVGPLQEPWIASLIWQSSVDPEGFYVAFEDLAMDPTDWRKAPPGQNAGNDGDFNDFVYYISGLNCAGGGQPCTTTLQGACSIGRTDCAAEGETPVCRPVIQPSTSEPCDNVDNDCNGFVDDDPAACEAGYVCDKGVCVDSCASGEFPCPTNYTCVMGACIETACATVDCTPGTACRAGSCVDPCTGVVCPGKQQCQLGRCVDLCAGITCPDQKVCDRGVCVPNCNCRACDTGLSCEADGTCSDPACVGITCPAGESCYLGMCKNLCEGVICPGGAACVNGACGDPGTGSGGVGSGGLGIGGGLTFGGNTASGGTSSGNPRARGRDVQDPGCACRSHAGSQPRSAWLGALLTGLALGIRRRKQRAA